MKISLGLKKVYTCLCWLNIVTDVCVGMHGFPLEQNVSIAYKPSSVYSGM